MTGTRRSRPMAKASCMASRIGFGFAAEVGGVDCSGGGEGLGEGEDFFGGAALAER